MKKIGIVTCKKRLNKVEDDLIIKKFLIQNGFLTDIIAWDDKSVIWQNYDILFIRSVWNSSRNYKNYCNFLLKIQNMNIRVINDINIILNNLSKKSINNLKFSVYIKNSYFSFKKDVICTIEKLHFESFVLKPIVGESSYHVFRYNKSGIKTKNSKNINYIIKKIYNDKKYGNPGILIEEFQKNIFYGEYCVFFFNKKIIYALKKYPSVFQTRKDVEIINNIPSSIMRYIIKNNLMNDGYGRIDLLYNRKIYLMEIEYNDPDLYLRKLNNDDRMMVMNEILNMIDGDKIE